MISQFFIFFGEKALHCNNNKHSSGQKASDFLQINAQWSERPQISTNWLTLVQIIRIIDRLVKPLWNDFP